jgi:hypothetical protein
LDITIGNGIGQSRIQYCGTWLKNPDDAAAKISLLRDRWLAKIDVSSARIRLAAVRREAESSGPLGKMLGTCENLSK